MTHVLDQPDALDQLREAVAAMIADKIRTNLADEPAEAQERAVRLALTHPVIAARIEAGALRLAGRLN